MAEQKQKIRVRLSGYDYQAVDAACGRVREIAERNGFTAQQSGTSKIA